MTAAGLLRDFQDESQDPVFSQVVELDLGSVVPSLSGPKRPHDRVSVSEMKSDFENCLVNSVGKLNIGAQLQKNLKQWTIDSLHDPISNKVSQGTDDSIVL